MWRAGDLPWHKASFSVASGALLDPPAVDALPHFAVRIADGLVFVTLPGETAAIPPRASGDSRSFVIIGAGAAGALAAQTLREEVLLGACSCSIAPIACRTTEHC